MYTLSIHTVQAEKRDFFSFKQKLEMLKQFSLYDKNVSAGFDLTDILNAELAYQVNYENC